MEWSNVRQRCRRSGREAFALFVAFFSSSALAADTTPPTAPASLSGIAAPSSTQIDLTWGSSTDDVGVTAYLLERCKGVGCTAYSQIASVVGTSYSNTALTAATSYSYRVRARDAANNRSTYSPVATIVTPPDTIAPSIPQGLTVNVLSNTQLSLSWSASTDNVKATAYLIERCAGVGCSTFAQISAPTATAYTNSALTPSTSYSYRIRAKDAAGNMSGYSTTVTASTPPDTQAPTIPGGVTATANSSSKITVTWTASTDDVKVTGYKVERCTGVGCSNFTQVIAPTGTSYANSGLAANTPYSYRVRATDAAGNLSAYSTIVTATTLPPPDTQAPTAPTGLSSSNITLNSLQLSWTTSTDNVGVTGYQVERCQGVGCTTFALVGTASTSPYNDSALTHSTTYRYRVRASDAANNFSVYSAILDVATQSLGPITYNYSYDSLGRIKTVVGTDGSVSTYEYDSSGNMVTLTRQ